MDTVAPCYEYFLLCLEKLQKKKKISTSDSPFSNIEWRAQEIEEFPQYFTYERTRHLVLWKIDAVLT